MLTFYYALAPTELVPENLNVQEGLTGACPVSP